MLDLIYTDEDFIELGVLQDYAYELTYGDAENSFDIIFGVTSAPRLDGCLIYADGTDYGGMVKSKSSSTKDRTVTYHGASWHGVLDAHQICPPDGKSHLVCKGDAHDALRSIVESIGLGNLFFVADGQSGIDVDHQFRFVSAYKGIRRMLAKAKAKLVIQCECGRLMLSAVPAAIHDSANESNAEFDLTECSANVNHLICLGRGELEERLRIDLSLDPDGNVGQTQYYYGIHEVAEKYENTNADYDKLLESGTERLLELQETSSIDMASEIADDYDIGDYVTCANLESGMSATAVVATKTVTVINGIATFSCEVGSGSSSADEQGETS